ncbi:MAG: ABC-F family ATP-binding cassette domain-containing protein, partial [Thermoguttaceae bacterium]|nr:ABC-F family ATP-binding cassette domain-containing protein [Thermoguttaceae bacterium]
MIYLSLQSVRKHFSADPVLMDVNFEIRPGERVGLVGPNGTGKTTLMKIIAGKEDADGGKIEIHPSVRMGYLEQTPDYSAGRTLIEEARHAFDEILSMHKQAEEVAAAMAVEQDPKELERLALRYDHLQTVLHTHNAYNIDYKVERVLEGLGFARSQFNTMVEQLSGGEQNRLMLAKLLLAEPDLMLLDEPSNHLDIEATEWLEDFIANGTAAVLVVSHDRYFLDKTTTRTLELFRGTVDSYTGNFSAYWTQKAERLAVETKTYEKQQEEIEKAKEFIRRNHYGMKAGQAEDRRKKLERIVPVPPPRKIEVPPMGFSKPSRSGDVPLKVVGLQKSYDRPLFKNVTFTIQRGERWGILGPNGAGKTTLLRCILGKESPDAGQSQIGGAVRIGYFDQQLHEVPDDAEVIDSIIPPKEEIVRTGESKGGFTPTIKDFDEPKRRSMLARFGITGDMVFQK